MGPLLKMSGFPPLVSTPQALQFSFPFHALGILHKHTLSCWEQLHNGKMVWPCTGAFPACGALPQGGYHFCSGPGHWPQLKSAQQVRTAKVSGRVLTAGARHLSNLNRNDRSTGKAAGMPGGTNKHRRGVGHRRNWWNHLQGYCHVPFHPGEVLGLEGGENRSGSSGEKYWNVCCFSLWALSCDKLRWHKRKSSKGAQTFRRTRAPWRLTRHLRKPWAWKMRTKGTKEKANWGRDVAGWHGKQPPPTISSEIFFFFLLPRNVNRML